MKRTQSKYILAHPARRPLRIFASDPMLARFPGNRITIHILNEPLELSEPVQTNPSDPDRPRGYFGPIGSRFEVIDYDGVHDCFYPPVDLNDPIILMQGGLEPTESDPRFHQQMVYAVAMRTLENFERALGRRLDFGRSTGTGRLRMFPHAFYGANAYYDPEMNAILFGYFRADRLDPGPNLPGQTVFTCLSHDIIVHELTHAIVDQLREYFLEPSNMDVLAFHEAFSDIVALFQHFTFRDFLRDQIQKTRGDIRRGEVLVELARQFGYATGANRALRSAIGDGEDGENRAKRRLSPSLIEPHERGSILVAAVFDAFYDTYQNRIRDLLRIATGGTGNLPEGDLHPDLVNRIADEASRTAQAILTMCIRAFDYLPPVDITFGDYLRALVTADYELQPADESGLRGAMIEGFRNRGIYPEDVTSLAEESLVWPDAPLDFPSLDHHKIKWANEIALASTAFSLDPFRAREPQRSEASSLHSDLGMASTDYGGFSAKGERGLKSTLKENLKEYALQNAERLHLDRSKEIKVSGFNTVFRVAPGGQLLTELVAQFCQQDESRMVDLGGVPFRGGTTIVAGTDGRIRYVIAKPLPAANIGAAACERGEERLKRQVAYVTALDLADVRLAYGDDTYHQQRSLLRMKIAALHEGVG